MSDRLQLMRNASVISFHPGGRQGKYWNPSFQSRGRVNLEILQ